MQFQINDRVKFTDAYLEANADYIDPAITEEECRGTVIDIVGGKLKIQFDDGTTELYHPEAFEHL